MCRVRRVSTGTATTPTEGPAPGADVDQASGSSSETSDTPLTMAVTVSATALPAAVVNHMVEHTQAIEPHAVIEIQETEQISLPENSAGIALIKTPTIRGNNDVDPVILTGDFGKVVKLKSERSLTDNEMYVLLKKHFIPAATYKFPCRSINGQTRSFQHSWLSKYNGLVYSESDDGGYCKFCVLFGKCECSVNELGVLVVSPFTNFKKASEKLSEHFINQNLKGKRYHQCAATEAASFISVMECEALRIDNRINAERAQRVKENRLKIRSIVETVIFCGRQGIAFRGHRDDCSDVQDDPNGNHGNFLALLNFRIQAGDKVLEGHMKNSASNALYTSKTVQNELIVICGDIIRNKILVKVRQAKYFSIIADEATDIANDEQLSICIRYVEEGVPQEKFIAFHECVSGVTGEALSDNIISNLAVWQLQPHLLRGQAYDGAGAMSGISKGVAARIVSKYPKALYTHCASHRLNLCVVKCCSVQEINSMMQTADSISRFFCNSPKRQLALEKWIEELLPEEKRSKMKQLCKTRWVERHEAFEVFRELFMPIVCCMEDIASSHASEWNRESKSDANSFLHAISQFPFVVALVLSHNVLSYTKGLSVKLQGRYVDVVRAHNDVEGVKSTIKEARCKVDIWHARIYSEAIALAESVGVTESCPRKSCIQLHRANPPADNISEHYKRIITIPMLDHLITELDMRFDKETTSIIVECIQLMPSEMLNFVSEWQPDFSNLLKLYGDDLPFSRGFATEIDMWKIKWTTMPSAEKAHELDTPEKVLKHTDKDFFPNIHALLFIITTLPVTSCECERSISLLRQLKTALRSTMKEDRLNSLALLKCHREINIDPEEVVEEFSHRHPRRMLLTNPFAD